MKIIDVKSASKNNVPQSSGNEKKFIVVHYLGCVGQNNKIESNGCGAHFYIYYDGTVYQAADENAVVWQVGTAGYYKQKHPVARNSNCIGIEMCVKCDGNTNDSEDKTWYFTEETQKSCVELVKYLMQKHGIPASNVIRHFDVVNKTCPAPYVHNNKYKTSWNWNEFKSKLTTTTASSNGTQASVFKGLTEQKASEIIGEICKEDCKTSGILASVSAAQFILESGYGTTDLAQNANNCFGMKCSLSGNTWSGSTWDGSSKYTKQTKEQKSDGTEYTVTADFRKYPCIEKSVADHSAYLLGAKNGSAFRYAGLKGCTDYKKAITIIKNGGYATDVKYIDKICSIIEKWNLTRFDSTASVWYRVRKSWSDANSQIGAFHDLENAKTCAKEHAGYSVFDESGNVVFSNFTSYMVKVNISALNIRSGAGTNFKISGCIRDKGTYTIVEEKTGQGATKWGKLKSGAGWISLDYCTIVTR